MFHFHKYSLVKKIKIQIKFSNYSHTYYDDGLKILEKCSCGKYKAYLMDFNGTKYYKVPELLFPELYYEK
ncbi:MAG: hypothetical protein ABIJ17_03195 [Patescibacteria group bacterium]